MRERTIKCALGVLEKSSLRNVDGQRQHQIIGHMIAVAVLYEISYLGEAELELYCSSLMLIVVIEFFQANV